MHAETPLFIREIVAGVAGLEPVTSAVTGQRSNQLSYTPAKGDGKIGELPLGVKFWFREVCRCKKSGWQTPRRWGWGTPLKKRAATRINGKLHFSNYLSTIL